MTKHTFFQAAKHLNNSEMVKKEVQDTYVLLVKLFRYVGLCLVLTS